MDELGKEFRSYKRSKLKEYRVSRPSDISGGRGTTSSLGGTDFRSLMQNIKARISQGEKRNLVVKDELIKYWKDKSKKSTKDILKRFNTASLVTSESYNNDDVDE